MRSGKNIRQVARLVEGRSAMPTVYGGIDLITVKVTAVILAAAIVLLVSTSCPTLPTCCCRQPGRHTLIKPCGKVRVSRDET